MQSSLIHEADEADFDEKVIARSREVPVVVDFWAEWCGPCRTLGPLLEREVEKLGGRVELVKVDTDRAQRLAQRYRVRGIPAVFAFKDGAVVDEFVGAQGPAYVREFLARLAPSPEQQQLDQALTARARGDNAGAEALARQALAAAGPGTTTNEAAILLGRVLLETGREGEVEAALERVDPRSEAAERADDLRRMVELAGHAREYGGEAKAKAALQIDEGDLEARYALAAALAARGQTVEALEHLIEIVGRSRKFRDDGARRAMLAIFGYLGGDSDVVREYRRRLQVIT